jgi:hypothetical protein
MGIVATTAHQSGSAKSAISPRTVNVIQNIFFSMLLYYALIFLRGGNVAPRARSVTVRKASRRRQRVKARPQRKGLAAPRIADCTHRTSNVAVGRDNRIRRSRCGHCKVRSARDPTHLESGAASD